MRILDSGDHIFSRREPRSIMENVLSEELFGRAEERTEAGEPPQSRVLQQVSAK